MCQVGNTSDEFSEVVLYKLAIPIKDHYMKESTFTFKMHCIRGIAKCVSAKRDRP